MTTKTAVKNKIIKICKRLNIPQPKSWFYEDVISIKNQIDKEVERRKKICSHCLDGVQIGTVICKCEVKKLRNIL